MRVTDVEYYLEEVQLLSLGEKFTAVVRTMGRMKFDAVCGFNIKVFGLDTV